MIETYIPLYRKYRPQQFSDLVGQEVVSTALGNALVLNKITHAYLFCGPRGTGKTSSARIFAKSLNCLNGPTATPCQICPNCIAITEGNALDVTEIDAASNNGVENIRELTDKVQFSPIQGKFKIYIIDEVHMLSTAAFNALLKTLEEPPPNVVFIFATTEPHKVLPTIISRCQRFDFNRITRVQIENRINRIAEQEGIKISAEAVVLIARHVRGGLRDALSLLDQVAVLGLSESDRLIQPEDVRAFIGMLEEELLEEVTTGIIEKDPAKILEQLGCLQERGVEPAQTVRELTYHFRNILIAKSCGPKVSGNQFDLSQEYYQRLCQQSQGFEGEEIPQILARFSLMESQLKNSHQPQLWLEIGLLDICYRHDIHLVKQLSERVTALEEMLHNSNGRSAAVVPPVNQLPEKSGASKSHQKKSVTGSRSTSSEKAYISEIPEQIKKPMLEQQTDASGNLREIWQRIVGSITMSYKSLIEEFFILLDMSDNALTIGYSSEACFNTFKKDPQKQKNLEQIVQAVLGKPCTLNFVANNHPLNKEIQPSVAGSDTVSSSDSQREKEPQDNHSSQVATVLPEKVELNIENSIDSEMEQVKQYTKELLQGRLLE